MCRRNADDLQLQILSNLAATDNASSARHGRLWEHGTELWTAAEFHDCVEPSFCLNG